MAAKCEIPTFVRLDQQFKRAKQYAPLPVGLSYNDVYVRPGYSSLDSRDEVSTRTELVKGIPLAIPIVSANMDSVTEAPMATFIARVGGIGIIHRAMSIGEQVAQVTKVKDATKYIVDNPPKLKLDHTVSDARRVMEDSHRGFIIITDEEGRFAGIITTRDVLEIAPGTDKLAYKMTPKDKVFSAPPGVSMREAQQVMYDHRVEKLPLIDTEGNLGGVITQKDIETIKKYPYATIDEQGRLRVGAAVGVQSETMERVQALVEEGVDVLVVDVLHGDSRRVHETIKKIKAKYPSVPVIGGNVARDNAIRGLIDAGADGIKVGYGDGALCSTRVETGTGAPQFTAVVECAAEVYRHNKNGNITTIADGSIQEGGDVLKALVAGGSTVMVGTRLSGTDQSPGEVFIDDETGERYKNVHGMASIEGQRKLAEARGEKPKNRVPQGVSAKVVYIGDATPVIERLVGGFRDGAANVGARNIKELQMIAEVGQQTSAGHVEGTPHIRISKRSR